MKFVVLSLLLCMSVLTFAAEEHVQVLNSDNFNEVVNSQDLTLVEFYAPWCGHCKSLAPEYAKAAGALEGKNHGHLAKVDCTVHQDLCERFSVRGFPTLKVFRGVDTVSDFDGARKAEAIVKFMEKQSSPPVRALTSASEVQEFSSSDSVVLVAVTSNDDEAKAFENLAKSLRNEFSFGSVHNLPAVVSELQAGDAKVIVYRDFDTTPAKFTGDFSAETFAADLTKFVRVNSFPTVGNIGPENYQKYLERGFNLVWIFVDLDDAAQIALIENVITPVAKDYADRLSFVKLDGVKWSEHAKSYGLSGNTPAIVIEDRQKHKNFAFDETTAPTADSFRSYVAAYLDGSLAPTVKSEPIPENNDKPVKVIVGKTFEQIVFDPTKNVLVEFYAPWCGHCKSLSPKYDELGLRFKDSTDVVIAKIDSTANDSPAEVQGYPTILFYPAGAENKQTPIDFNGERTVDAMEAFINENKVSSSSSSSSSSTATTHEEL